MAYVSRHGFLAAIATVSLACLAFVREATVSLVETFAGYYSAAVELVLAAFAWRPTASESVALDGAVRDKFSLSTLRLPNWFAFLDFRNRQRWHGESFSHDGFTPEVAY